MLTTPVLFIIFNKPNKTQLVFNQIKEVKPKHLFVAADAPKIGNVNDELNCKITRNIIAQQVDWDCEVHLHFRNDNLGCGKGPSDAITWFFENVEEGIILEDDCVPHIDFFYYCQELLIKYRDDKQIMSIGGVNFQDGKQRSDGSYYFSKHNAIWGWASWRRVWKQYDYYITGLNRNDFEKTLAKTFSTKKETNFWLRIFDDVKQNRLNDSCWDYQFMFMIWTLGGLAILPNINLVSNIGFDVDATHTFDSNNPCANIQTKGILPLTHPSEIKQNKKADFYYYNKCLETSKISPYYVKRKFKNLIRKINRYIKA